MYSFAKIKVSFRSAFPCAMAALVQEASQVGTTCTSTWAMAMSAAFTGLTGSSNTGEEELSAVAH
jgi:hypothetical protein